MVAWIRDGSNQLALAPAWVKGAVASRGLAPLGAGWGMVAWIIILLWLFAVSSG